MIAFLVASLISPVAIDKLETDCNEICAYYTNRLAPPIRDKSGYIMKSYKLYTNCILNLSKALDWSSVVGKEDAQRFMDQAWSQCAAERISGDKSAIAVAKTLPGVDPAKIAASVSAKRAINIYILVSLIFQKAGRGSQMSDYVKEMRAKLAPELIAK